MTDTLHIQIDHAEGSLQRLIGLIERRGFHIDGMTLAGEGAMRHLQLQVRGRDSGRCIEILGRQIDRMIGATRMASSCAVQAFQTEVAA
ncbi:ACT domain-containing protein [uncultured Brevundimonas sp.]|mgnify:FL=1|uniref:ACT domain-containing protein n=1 Tax=uncultured Brevundimonas sp. TaxID=213418 RepID=UPI0030EF3DBC|tara:strand:+ start:94742 stop:95008 length:267 start_codon:yes stop_codon:yes gene_type:complete